MLCEKDTPLSSGFKSNYCGFIVPNFFIVGNGFDFDEVMREMPHVGCISQYGIEYYTKHKLFCSVSNTHDTLIRSVLLVCVDLQQSLRQSLVYAFLPPLQTPHSPLSTRHHHRSNGRKMRLKTPVWNLHGLSCELRTMCALSAEDTQTASLSPTCQIEHVDHFQSLHHPIFEIPQK